MIDGRIRLRHLSCFLEVANAGSIVKAAERLFISQPAVSKTILELEEILSVRLFERSKLGVTLTPLGELFHSHASSSLASLREGVLRVSESGDGGSQHVAIGVLPTVAARLMPPAVDAYRALGGQGSVNLVTGPNELLLNQLRVAELDLVVGRLGESDLMVGLTFEHLYTERMRVVACPGHPLLSVDAFELGMIADYPLVLPSPGTVIRQDAERLLIAAGVWPLSDFIETFSATFARQYLERTDAVWIASQGVVADGLASGSLQELPVNDSPPEGPVGLTTRIDANPLRASALMVECIRAVAGDLREQDRPAPA